MNKEIIVELKNDIVIKGTLQSVDQFMNIKIDKISIENEKQNPYLGTLKNCFIRGSVVRYIHLPAKEVDVEILHDATRRNLQN